MDQVVHQCAVPALMIHGKHVYLMLHGSGQGGRIDFQGFIHEHIVIFPIQSLVFAYPELIAVLPEVQLADNAVQLVTTDIGFLDGASDFVNEVFLKMLHGHPGLLHRLFFIIPDPVAGQLIQQLLIFPGAPISCLCLSRSSSFFSM